MKQNKPQEIFVNLPFDDAMIVFERYLIAKHANNQEVLQELEEDYPDLFIKPNIMFMAKQTFKRAAKLTNNRHWLDLIELDCDASPEEEEPNK